MPDTPNLPATGFANTSLANIDLNRFRNALDVAEQNAGGVGGKQFLRMNRSGVWVYGNPVTETEDGAEFAINPLGLEQGYVAWGQQGGKPLGQLMRSILQPPIDPGELPPVTGAEWTPNIGISMRCLNGEDAGMEFEYNSNSYGGKAAFAELVRLFKAQLDLDASRLYPVIELESEDYRHATFGQIFNPIFAVKRWLSEAELVAAMPAAAPAAAATAAPAPAPAPAPRPAAAPAPAPQPTTRRRGAVAAPAPAPAPQAAAEQTGAARGRRRAAR